MSVRKYKDKDLLNKVKELDSFEKIPANYWALFVRSNEDTRTSSMTSVTFSKVKNSLP